MLLIIMTLILFLSFSLPLSFSVSVSSFFLSIASFSFFPACFSSLLSVRQPNRSSRTWTRRRVGLLPAPFLLLPPHLPPRPVPAEWRRLRLLLAGSQSGGHAEWQPVVAYRALLPPPAGTSRRRHAIPAERQLQLRKPEH